MIFTGLVFHPHAGDPPSQKACKGGSWIGYKVTETVLLLPTTICTFKKVVHRIWTNLWTRLAYAMVFFNMMVQ